MAYVTKLDLAKESKISSGDTASLDGSIIVGQNLTINGNTFLTNIQDYNGNNSKIIVRDNNGELFTSVIDSSYFTGVTDNTLFNLPLYKSGNTVSIDLSPYYLKSNPAYYITSAYTGFDTRYKPLSYIPTWNEITGKPNNVSYFTNDSGYITGNYTGFDTRYKPLNYIPTWSEITSKPNFATVATSGNYNDLINKPTGSTQTQTDWNQTGSTSLDYIKNKPDLSAYYLKSNPSGFTTQTYVIGYAQPKGNYESGLTFTLPLVRSGNGISINQSGIISSGYLSSTDWNIFNNKANDNNVIHKTLDETKNGSLSVNGVLGANSLLLSGNTPNTPANITYFNQRILFDKTLEVYQGVKYGGGNEGILIDNLTIKRYTNNGNTVDLGLFHSDLANVAFSGDYNDLINRPSTTSGSTVTQIQSDWNQANNNSLDYIKNKPVLGDLAFINTGYTVFLNITGTANTANVANSVAWNNVTGKPNFATVATSGNYNDLINKPIITNPIQTDWNQTNNSSLDYIKNKPVFGSLAFINTGSTVFLNITGNADSANMVPWAGVTGKPNFATVATSGNYNDLINKPTISGGTGVQVDWNQTGTTSLDYIKNKPLLGNLAFINTGSTVFLNITGNASTSTTWNTFNNDSNPINYVNNFLLGFGNDNLWHPVTSNGIKSYLGLQSAAYTQSSDYVKIVNTVGDLSLDYHNYFVNSSAFATNNPPDKTWFAGLSVTINNDTNYKKLLGFDENYNIWSRSQSNGNWNNWQKLLTEDSDSNIYNKYRIDISGTADIAKLVGNDSTNMRFHWSGQGGQPSWLWGGNDPNNMYVYNPSNFSVNYANSAGSVEWNNIQNKILDTLQTVTNRGNTTSNSINIQRSIDTSGLDTGQLLLLSDSNLTGDNRIVSLGKAADGGYLRLMNNRSSFNIKQHDGNNIISIDQYGTITTSGDLSATTIRGKVGSPVSQTSYGGSAFESYTLHSDYLNGARPGYGFHAHGDYGTFLYASSAKQLRLRAIDNSDYALYSEANFIVDVNGTNNTVVQRDGNGQVFAGYFNTQAALETPSTPITGIFATYDNYIRKISAPSIQQFLGLKSAAYNQNGDFLHNVQYLGATSMDVGISSGIFRNENGLGGNIAFAPVLSLNTGDVGLQINGGFNSDILQFRGLYNNNTTYTPWRKIWHDGNFNPANYLSSEVDTLQSVTTRGSLTTKNITVSSARPLDANSYFANSYTNVVQATDFGNGARAGYGFDSPGHFGAFIYHNNTNEFRFRNNLNQDFHFWTTADFVTDSNATPNTVVTRDVSGHIYGAYLNTTASLETSPAPITGIFASYDSYIRRISAPAIQQFLGLNTLAYRTFVYGNEVSTDRNNQDIDINVSKYLRWRSYGSNHIIFDASSGTNPDGGAIDRIVPAVEADGLGIHFPTLMGYNGVSTYGVRVSGANRFWSTSHPNDYYSTINYDGTYWQMTVNHPSAINVGRSNLSAFVENDAASMRFHWSGQGGQPSWLWGGNDPNNMYVYNPSNFSVNYATSAGSANESLQSVRNRNFAINAVGTGRAYDSAAFQVRESDLLSGASTVQPRFAFHWAGVVASQIAMENSGRIAILNNPGTNYENFIAATITATGNLNVLGDTSIGGTLTVGTVVAGLNTKWGGTSYPTVRSNTGDEFVMIHKPHLPFLKNGQYGYTGSDDSSTGAGAIVRMASNYTAANYWDMGIKLPDQWSVSRGGTIIFNINSDSSAHFTNDVYANNFRVNSSEKLKKNIEIFNFNALELVNNTIIYNYEYNDSDVQRIGIIAERSDEKISGKEHDSFLVPDTVALLIKAVQELSKELEELKQKIK